jgi:hypothetical protein
VAARRRRADDRHWSLFFVKTWPFAHTRNRLCERRDGAPQLPHGTFAANAAAFRVTAIVALSPGFLPMSHLPIWCSRLTLPGPRRHARGRRSITGT